MWRCAKPAARCAAFHQAGLFKETAQDESKASCFGRRNPEDGRLDWTKPARQLHNLVRAVTDPWPGAYSFAGVSKFIVWKSRVRDDIPAAKPGTVVSVSPLVVSCGEQALEILTGQTDNGVYVQARSWRNPWVWLRVRLSPAHRL